VYSTGPSAGVGDVNEITDAVEIGSTVPGAPFLAKVVVVISIANTITVTVDAQSQSTLHQVKLLMPNLMQQQQPLGIHFLCLGKRSSFRSTLQGTLIWLFLFFLSLFHLRKMVVVLFLVDKCYTVSLISPCQLLRHADSISL
jgi:hypothetical protein